MITSNRHYLYALALLLLLLAGCGRNERLYPFRWDKSDPLTDSLTLALDAGLYQSFDTDSMTLLLERLDGQARGDEKLKNRVDFFRGAIMEREDKEEEGKALMRRVLERMDSTDDPYLYNRLLDQTDEEEISPDAYTRILGRLEFFRDIDDPFLTGVAALDLGNLLKNSNDTDGALAAYAEADSMLRRAGYPHLAAPIDINRANVLQTRGDSVEGTALLRHLLKEPMFADDVSFRYMILSNLLSSTLDTVAAREMVEMQLEAGGNEEYDSKLCTFLSEIEYDRGNYRRALHLARVGYQLATAEENVDLKAKAMQNLASTFEALGDIDSAYYYLSRETVMVDSIELARLPAEIQATETGRIIAMRKMERELAKGKEILWVALVIFVVFVCVICVAGVMVWRIQRMRLRQARAVAEREKAHRRLLATQILVEEKNALLNTLSRDLSNLEEKGEISAGTKGHIAAPIKTHIVQAANRENFLETFAELHPDFAERLKERSPEMTDSDIRLAKYIAVGLESKQIASTLGIRPESVKQARWRLRTKLQLATADSLDDYLKGLL